MKQLLYLFPSEINNFYEPFCGGGTVFLNISAKRYFINDIDKNLIKIHKYLIDNASNSNLFFSKIDRIIEKYNLSRSFKEDIVPIALKKQWKKTYFAKFNKPGYDRLRECVNKNRKNDPLILYLLLIYGFNRMLRFNGGGKFNLPVGNVDFNKNVKNALYDYFNFTKDKKIKFSSKDFRDFISSFSFDKNDFIYFDPPYLIAESEYNKSWNNELEIELLKNIEEINKKGFKFALSNVIEYNGKENTNLKKWMKQFNVHSIQSNYINYHNNSQKQIKEVLITNY